MSYYADPWLREARDRVSSGPSQALERGLKAAEFDRLADAVEKAIKAALIENHGSIPQEHNHKKLVALCQSTGVWDILPPALKNLVQEVESYRLTNTAEFQVLTARPSSSDQMQRYFSVARRLIDYMEYHVIGNDSVLKRLKVV
ncbi:MAG TPA: HEPN domain-containing protein [Candidatus Udaeobacter sp.]|jgi:HEPN domain-containing protein|nr:HEPN domain-containing protein [Candidatus Udaeobacter sp.]